MIERTTAPATTAKPRRWDPFDLLTQMQTDFDQFWNDRWSPLRPLRRSGDAAGAWAPHADVYEQGGKLVVKAELPGVKKEDVDVSIDNGDLVIRGERHAEEKVEEKDYYRMERSSGTFYRRLPLPEGVTFDQITATYKDGVLEVTAPKLAIKPPDAKKIAIN
jgi:HSP20 family protein